MSFAFSVVYETVRQIEKLREIIFARNFTAVLIIELGNFLAVHVLSECEAH